MIANKYEVKNRLKKVRKLRQALNKMTPEGREAITQWIVDGDCPDAVWETLFLAAGVRDPRKFGVSDATKLQLQTQLSRA